jgi:NAD-dependent DNA ligase
MYSYLYYEKDISLIPDTEYDIICKRLYNEWDKVEHFHKHIVNKEALIAGTGYQLKYPERVKNAAIALKEKYTGKELGR